MTQEQELSILRPWAKQLMSMYDIVVPYKVIDDINVYHLAKAEWGVRHKIGMPILAILENSSPRLLDDDEVLSVVTA